MELELKDIFQLLKKGKLLLILLPLITMLASGILSFYYITPVYSSSAILLVNNKSQMNIGGLNIQDIQLSTELTKTYSMIAVSRSVAEKVIQMEKLNMTYNQFIGKISVQPIKDSQLIRVTVQDSNPKTAAHLANVTSNVFMKMIMDIMELNSNGAKIIDIAVPSNSPINANKELNIVMAGLVGLISAIGIVLLRECIDHTFKSSKDVERHIELPIYGIIPKIK